MDGFEAEGLVQRDVPDPAVPAANSRERVVSEQVHRSGSTTVTEREVHTDLAYEPGDIGASLGLVEHNFGG